MPRKKSYVPRIADRLLERRLNSAGAVHIVGPKWCGKTSTAQQRAASTLFMQDPDELENNFRLAETKPSVLLRGAQPRLIDEWQVTPQLWDAVRFACDREGGCGHYILTGSATPGQRPLHSGAGRFAPLRMRTMSLAESRESSREVSLEGLFNGDEALGSSNADIEGMAWLVARGGWPDTLGRIGDAALDTARNYLTVIAEEDVSRIDGVSRNPERVRALLRSYARNVATQAASTVFEQDMVAVGQSLSTKSITDYLSILRGIYVVEDLPAWSPSLRSKATARTSPTRHLVDPSIAVAALGATPDGLVHDMQTFGLLFESLCIRDLRIYAEAAGGSVWHYRDSRNREVDAVVTYPDGRWALFEMKLGEARADEAASHLVALAADIRAEREVSFLAVITAGRYAYTRKDGVHVIPLATMAP